jgi:flagellar biosynthetic protein FliP
MNHRTIKKLEIRSPQSETNPKSEGPKHGAGSRSVSNFGFPPFELISDFEIRASDFRPRSHLGLLILALVLMPSPAAFGQIGSKITPLTMPQIPAQNKTVPAPANVPTIGELVSVMEKATSQSGEGKEWSTPVKLVIIFGALTILPSLLVMMTSFTRIVIVLSFVRRALTTQSIPPTIAIMGLGLFLTFYTMAPTYAKMNAEAIQPYLADKITFGAAAQKASDCIKDFMLRQSRKADLALFIQMAKAPAPATPMDVPMHIVVPAFIISEFRTAFEIGCLLFIPFLLIDMVIASVLLSAGMMMLPPVMISLPFKLILFILVDGWGLLARSLSLGFR